MPVSHPPSPELLRQKKALNDLEKALKNQKTWLQRRDEIVKELECLKEDIQKISFQIYSSKKNDKEKEIQIKNEIDPKKSVLLQLKKEQGQLDQWLDPIVDITEDNLQNQRLELLFSIWDEYPSIKKEQEIKWNRLNELSLIELELKSVEKILERLRKHTQIAQEARQSIKGIGILNYIFGVSPNVIIEKQLKEIHLLINQSKPLLQKILENESLSLKQLIKALIQWLEELKKKCEQSWNFKHIDKLTFEMQNVLHKFEQEITNKRDKNTIEIKNLNDEMNQWLEII